MTKITSGMLAITGIVLLISWCAVLVHAKGLRGGVQVALRGTKEEPSYRGFLLIMLISIVVILIDGFWAR